MPREKERATLKSAEYKINGNLIRAFYDKRGKLVFVLDSTIDELKPNVLLVMNSYGDRKWDDVLSNDYGMDLELVRPKKDNKYQKLDVEYDGLDVYDDLIQAYQDGKKNLKAELAALQGFRIESVRRSATERLAASTEIAENARETIDRTSDTIVELQVKIKAARSKVSTLRRNVGKEPTKQSAAKILKAEAQMDVLNTKLERANKRLENANKRLLVAEDDIEAAHQVLDSLPDGGDVKPAKPAKTVNKLAPKRVVKPQEEDDDDLWINDNDDDEQDETDEDYDDDSDVEPLFKQDPNIMDEKIAFKPISFDETPATKSKTTEKVTQQNVSFQAPKSMLDVVQVPENADSSADDDVKLDDVFSEGIDDNVVYPAPTVAVQEETEEIETKEPATTEETANDVPVVMPDMDADKENTSPVLLQKQEETTEIVSPDVAPNLTEDLIRPVAPGKPASATHDDAQDMVRPQMPITHVVQNTTNQQTRKPNLLYYILLLVLIALSVFTLWLYQRSNVSVDAVPELATDTNVVVSAKTDAKVVAAQVTDENPFIDVDVTQEKVTKQTEQPAPEVKAPEVKDNVTDEQLVDPVSQPVDIDDAPVVPAETGNTNVQGSETCDTDDKSVADDGAADKPEYDVTQATVLTDKDLTEEDGNLCSDGTAPDSNGCCTGEVYSTIDGEKACCPREGGDCFPPMF